MQSNNNVNRLEEQDINLLNILNYSFCNTILEN